MTPEEKPYVLPTWNMGLTDEQLALADPALYIAMNVPGYRNLGQASRLEISDLSLRNSKEDWNIPARKPHNLGDQDKLMPYPVSSKVP